MSKKPAVRHLTKFDGGRRTPEEVHREAVYGGIKCHCGCPAVGKAISFASVEDLSKHDMPFLIDMARMHNGQVPIVQFKYGKFVRMGTAYYCGICKSACEKAMAKLPSWVLVEWEGGPAKTKPQVQVAGA